ncbi:hypothetical protein M885DRAFT_512813 [Pelagophyceae sp. CCMP2097]|nr:hypothetical protein M885DRAFT_512813 [Pelagophyceae sp. CCMP2097]
MSDLAEVVQEAKLFLHSKVKEGKALASSCTKPNSKEYLSMLWAVSIGCFVLGAVGAVVELAFIPVIRAITGVTVENRALYR